MERKDAIYWLNNLIGNYSDYYDEALEMGIKALEQQKIDTGFQYTLYRMMMKEVTFVLIVKLEIGI